MPLLRFKVCCYVCSFFCRSYGKVRFGSVRPEYLGPPLEVVLFDWSVRTDRNVPFHSQKFSFSVPFDCDVTGNFGRNVNETLRSRWELNLKEKGRSIFPWLVPLVLDLIVTHNGMYPKTEVKMSLYISPEILRAFMFEYISGAQAREERQRSTMGKIFWEIYPCENFWL